MKLLLTAILLLFISKGVVYILFPKFVINCAQKLLNTPDGQLVAFGWILVLVSAMAWLGCVRYID